MDAWSSYLEGRLYNQRRRPLRDWRLDRLPGEDLGQGGLEARDALLPGAGRGAAPVDDALDHRAGEQRGLGVNVDDVALQTSEELGKPVPCILLGAHAQNIPAGAP